LALLAGLLQAASIAPQPLAVLNGLALLLLVLLLQGSTPSRSALLGWLFSLGWLTVSVWWLYISMHRYGGLPAVLAAAAVLALAAFLSSYVAMACALVAWAWRRREMSKLSAALVFAAAWLLAELARAQWFTGFPWAATGDAHVEGLLAQLAPWLGVYGMGAVAAGLAAWWGRALSHAWCRCGRSGDDAPALPAECRREWRVTAGVVVGLLLLHLPLPPLVDFTAPAGQISVTLLQGNVAQDEKFDAELMPASLTWHREQLLAAATDLVLAPETAIPLLPQDLPDGYWNSLRDHFRLNGRAALFGAPMGDPARGYTNSALGLDASPALYRYDKHHLVPFGEFIPLGFRWFVDLMHMPLGDFLRGPLQAPSFEVRGLRVAPNICYEDLFGEDLAARFRERTDAPHVLANLSNIGWFGDSIAVGQHLQISRLRALELQRPMLRATNTGATVIIDHRGVVTKSLAPHTRGVLVGEVQGRSGETPFAFWAARFGLWPMWALGLAGVLALSRVRRGGPEVAARP
jgi:apolipoprotein N-acyltransferase